MSPRQPNLAIGELFGVKGLNVVVTGGGGQGLGAMMTRALAQNGASKIFIIGRRQSALEDTVATCPAGTVVPIQGDVTSKNSLASCAAQVASQVSHIDVLIANSGIVGPRANPPDNPNPTLTELRDFWWDLPMEDFTNVSHVNVTGMLYTVLAFLPLLQKANELRPPPSDVPRPQVICVTSIAGFMRSVPAGLAYNASKSAAQQIGKILATKLTDFKIRVNCIAPGPFMTEMTTASFPGETAETKGLKEGDKDVKFIPLTRAGGEEDIGGTILYLCSRAGGFLSGNTIILDGGRLGVWPATY